MNGAIGFQPGLQQPIKLSQYKYAVFNADAGAFWQSFYDTLEDAKKDVEHCGDAMDSYKIYRIECLTSTTSLPKFNWTNL